MYMYTVHIINFIHSVIVVMSNTNVASDAKP